MDKKLCVGMDLSGRDFSEADIRDTVFMNCNMKGVKFPATLWEMQGAVFINCYFDIIDNGEIFIAPLYNAKYRFRKEYSREWEIDGNITAHVTFSSSDLISAIDPKEICNNNNCYYGYKILVSEDNNYVIATLKINADTPAALFTNSKCRAERATVVCIRDFNGKQYYKAINICYFTECIYGVGDEVVADEWDPDIMVECTHGIHFFLTQQEAWEYSLYL